jgi:hypothetical protein
MPWSLLAVAVFAGFCGACNAAGVALAAGTAEGAVTAGREGSTSACTVRVETSNTPAVSTTEETIASSQMRRAYLRRAYFELTLLDLRRITI